MGDVFLDVDVCLGRFLTESGGFDFLGYGCMFLAGNIPFKGPSRGGGGAKRQNMQCHGFGQKSTQARGNIQKNIS